MEDILFSENLAFNTYTSRHNYNHRQPSTPRNYLSYLEEGSCRIVSDRITLEAQAGDLIYIPKGLQYHSFWFCDTKVQFKSFGFHYFPEAAIQDFPLQRIFCPEELAAQIQTIQTELPIDSRVIGTFYSILAAVLPVMQHSPSSPHAYILEKAKQYISQNTGCNVADIARHCAISQAALYELFRDHAGCTPNELRQKILCEQAVLLLSTTDRTVQDISDSLGFSSTSYFRKVLKSHTGKSPREIRRAGGHI